MKNIVLIGFMGSGKTAMGRFLSQELDYDFYDTDRELEAATGIKVNLIVKKYGKIRYDSEEQLVVKRLSQKERAVIATGGNFIEKNENVAVLKQNSVFVYLQVDDNVIVERLARRNVKPFREKGSLKELVPRIYDQCRPLYEKYADIIVNTTHLSMEETAEVILKELKNNYGFASEA
ncbi:MAG TPA: AAA family ATPase [Firmicutes bacterium]|nr:AAA family ATPase [Bacillota bacterium]